LTVVPDAVVIAQSQILTASDIPLMNMEADAVLIVETVVLVYRIFGSTWLDT
jgi:hypothetical protein